MQAETHLADRYELVRRLASGGMGEVWLARDAVLGREVGVKVIAVGSDSDQLAVERFRREATMTAALDHPNVVTIFDSGTHNGSAFIVMELLAGPTVAQLVADRGPLPEAEAVRLAAQIAAGLAAAHHAGVVHRDIKPSNLMFSSSGMLKILDFGIARLSQSTAPALTQTNAVIGSAPYLSPEQAVGAPADERSDLYSLGCVMVTMLTGLPPFTGEHAIAVLQQHVHNDPPLLRERQPSVSAATEALVGQLLNKRADARPASADEVEEQLTRILVAADDSGPAPTANLAETMGPMEARTVIQAATQPYPAATQPYPAATQPYPAAARPYPAAARPFPAAAGPFEIAAPRPHEVVRDRSAGTPPRSWWLVAAAIVAVVVLAAAVLMPLLTRTGEGASSSPEPGATSSPSTSTPREQASPKSTPQATGTGKPTISLSNVRAVVDDVVADGQMNRKRAEQFGRRLDTLEKELDKKGQKKKDDQDVSEQLDELSEYLSDLVEDGELSPRGFQRIEAALNEV